jgi:Lhr-like helicase
MEQRKVGMTVVGSVGKWGEKTVEQSVGMMVDYLVVSMVEKTVEYSALKKVEKSVGQLEEKMVVTLDMDYNCKKTSTELLFDTHSLLPTQ